MSPKQGLGVKGCSRAGQGRAWLTLLMLKLNNSLKQVG